MRKILVLLLFIAGFSVSLGSQVQESPLTAVNLPEFLARYQKNLDRVDAAYADLANENLPMRDEDGQPLGRHRLDDRRNELGVVRQTARQLAARPQDLVLTTRLFILTETLVDDLFDLAQIAYDNDREELGKRFSDLELAMDHERELVEAYVLSLAEEKQKRIQELEKKNRDLQKKLKAVEEPTREKPT